MKKYLSLALVSLLVVLPMGVKAATSVTTSCSAVDDNGIKTCTLNGSFDSGFESMDVTLTEQGGADITAISNTTGSEYLVGNVTESGSTHSFTLTHDDTTFGPTAPTGEVTLFTVSYKTSGEADCNLLINIGDMKAETPTPGKTPQKQTGSSVPYIALGTMVVLAGGAYLLTKNKAKMFNI